MASDDNRDTRDEQNTSLAGSLGEAIRESVSQAVQEALSESQSDSDEDGTSERNSSEPDDEESPSSDDETQGDGLLSFLPESLQAFVPDAVESQGEELLHSLVDPVVDLLFSQRSQTIVRNGADELLQNALGHALSPIDDRQERLELYHKALHTLRPVMRKLVNETFNDDDRSTFKEHGRAAVQHLLNGETGDALGEMGTALRKALPLAEEIISENSDDLLPLMREISTALMEDTITDGAESLEDRVQEKGEEIRDQLAEALEKLGERVEDAKQQLKDSAREERSRSRKRQPGQPPSGRPPSRSTPMGRPPSGRPPTGWPPDGRPPSGLPPSLETSKRSKNVSASVRRDG